MNLQPSRCLPLVLCGLGTLAGLLPAPGSADESRFIQNSRQLIYEGRRSGEGYYSADGKMLVFQSEREQGNPFFQIYTLDLEEGEVRRISPGHGKTTCAFIRPGTGEVLFASTHLDKQAREKQREELERRASGQEKRYSWDYDEHYDLFCADADGKRPRRLTRARGYDAEGSYSPDGRTIVFASNRQAYPSDHLTDKEKKLLEVDPAYFMELYVMDANGGNLRRLTNWRGYDGGPFFTPDGSRIVWRHFEENGAKSDVYTIRPDGTGLKRLTTFDAMSWAPYFHPSGEYCAFASNKYGFGNFEVFLVDADGAKQPVRVTTTDKFDGLPVFSPDGKHITWTSSRTGAGAQIFLANWNHEEARKALAEAPDVTAPHAIEIVPHAAPTADASTEEAPTATIARAKRFEDDIRADELREMVEFLASDEMGGRMTGTEGTRKSADAIAALFQELGLEPLGDDGTYFHEFEFTAGMEVLEAENSMKLTVGEETRSFAVEKDFRPLAFSSNGEVEGEVVVAGYGLIEPDKAGHRYDAYGDLDVNGKIVLVMRYVPEDLGLDRRQMLNVYAGLRYKAMVARERGAKALLVVTGPNSPNSGELVPLAFDTSLVGSGIVAASITGDVASQLLKAAGTTLADVQASLDKTEETGSGAFALPGARLQLSTSLRRIKKTDRNVVAYLPPNACTDDNPDIVLLGAHYDHIGRGETGGSLARKGETGEVHNGADDNASGTAVVLELAGKLAHLRETGEVIFPRGIAFALWSGEEIGLIGSAAFAEAPPVDLERIAAYFNFDMVGRLRDNKLIVQGVGSSPEWKRQLERRNVLAGFQLMLSEDPYAPTDITSFYPKGIPCLTFFTGSHEDYNRPSDDPDTLNYEGMERIAKFSRRVITDVATRTDRLAYNKVKSQRPSRGSRENLRAYLGTIPDYASDDVPGVKLSGVGGGGPADEAGLRGGDVIVKFGGKTITNIYDYTYALDAAKVGMPLEVVVLRDGKRLTFTVTPRARK